MLWVRTLSVFLPSLLRSWVVCPDASVGESACTGSASAVASSQALRIIILPERAFCSFGLGENTAQFRARCPAKNRRPRARLEAGGGCRHSGKLTVVIGLSGAQTGLS